MSRHYETMLSACESQLSQAEGIFKHSRIDLMVDEVGDKAAISYPWFIQVDVTQETHSVLWSIGMKMTCTELQRKLKFWAQCISEINVTCIPRGFWVILPSCLQLLVDKVYSFVTAEKARNSVRQTCASGFKAKRLCNSSCQSSLACQRSNYIIVIGFEQFCKWWKFEKLF